MTTLTEYINAVRTSAKQLEDAARYLSDFCHKTGNLWPDHQVRPADWTPRAQTPPAGWVWASDGMRVWLIQCDGKPIRREVTAVRFWTLAYIPAPPQGAVLLLDGEASLDGKEG